MKKIEMQYMETIIRELPKMREAMEILVVLLSKQIDKPKTNKK